MHLGILEASITPFLNLAVVRGRSGVVCLTRVLLLHEPIGKCFPVFTDIRGVPFGPTGHVLRSLLCRFIVYWRLCGLLRPWRLCRNWPASRDRNDVWLTVAGGELAVAWVVVWVEFWRLRRFANTISHRVTLFGVGEERGGADAGPEVVAFGGQSGNVVEIGAEAEENGAGGFAWQPCGAGEGVDGDLRARSCYFDSPT